ncbi:MAG: hypothetical protein KZQ95_01915 [Candidatus Thiodiazotropha sp. (ex Epidulcina cf. delphinae)]|nr:hypothetical protein [Candidatus Thiodiazotropha sp. (ex Epidulcina cf. delphinae)]
MSTDDTNTEQMMLVFEHWATSGGITNLDTDTDEDEFGCPYYLDINTQRLFFAFVGGYRSNTQAGHNPPVSRGDTVKVRGIGDRRVRQARKAGPCAGWMKKGGHTINPGDLYVETEIDPYTAGGFAMDRCCLDCLSD